MATDAKPPDFPCQTLLVKNGVYNGWLRQKKRFHELSDSVDPRARSLLQPISSRIPWGKRYVVVDETFLHIYKSETGSKPMRTLDLAEYHKVEKCEQTLKDVPWPFRLLSRVTESEILFGATSQVEQKTWMDAVGKGIAEAEKTGRAAKIIANRESLMTSSSAGSDCEEIQEEDEEDDYYDSIDPPEEPTPKRNNTTRSGKPVPPVPSNGKPSGTGDNRALTMPRKFTPTPPTPNDSSTTRPDLPKKLPATPAKPEKPNVSSTKPQPPIKTTKISLAPAKSNVISSKPVTNEKIEDSEDEGEMEDADYEEPMELGDIVSQAMWLKGTEEGTEVIKSFIGNDGVFMIRKSTTGNDELTLQLVSGNVVRKYKISKQGEKYSISGGNLFEGLSELLQFYQKNPVPNHPTKLTFPYSIAQKL